MPTIYTKTGDRGETGLGNGKRVSKDDLRIEVIGDVDEVNAILGVVQNSKFKVKNYSSKFKVDEWITEIQNDLFIVGAVISQSKTRAVSLLGERTKFFEQTIDALTKELPPLTNFILPGGSETGAAIHVARAVARRAERRVVALVREEADDTLQPIVVYLNRLSDFLFTLARWINQQEGVEEERWVF